MIGGGITDNKPEQIMAIARDRSHYPIVITLVSIGITLVGCGTDARKKSADPVVAKPASPTKKAVAVEPSPETPSQPRTAQQTPPAETPRQSESVKPTHPAEHPPVVSQTPESPVPDEAEETNPQKTTAIPLPPEVADDSIIVAIVDDVDFADKIAASKPLSPVPSSAEIAGKTIQPELCRLIGKQFFGANEMNIFRAIEVVGDHLVVIDHKRDLHGFVIEGDDRLTLSIDKAFGVQGVLSLDAQVDRLSRGSDGRVIASGYGNANVIKDGQVEFKCSTPGRVEMHSGGAWGITLLGSTLNRVKLSEGTCTAESVSLPKHPADGRPIFSDTKFGTVIGEDIVIGGAVKLGEVDGQQKKRNMVVVFDQEGKEKRRFGGPSDAMRHGFGWMHAINACSTGIGVLDSNMRTLSFWNNDGELLSALNLMKLFDLKYPWIADFTVAEDGTAYFVTGQRREIRDVAEGMIYRIDGI